MPEDSSVGLVDYLWKLWRERDMEQVKRIYRQVFLERKVACGGYERSKMLGLFVACSAWDDDPVEFGLTAQTLDNFNWEGLHLLAAERIQAGKFESESAYLHWQLANHERLHYFDGRTRRFLVDVERIQLIVSRFKELGEDTSCYENLQRELLTRQLTSLKRQLQHKSKGSNDPALQEALDHTEKQLQLR